MAPQHRQRRRSQQHRQPHATRWRQTNQEMAPDVYFQQEGCFGASVCWQRSRRNCCPLTLLPRSADRRCDGTVAGTTRLGMKRFVKPIKALARSHNDKLCRRRDDDVCMPACTDLLFYDLMWGYCQLYSPPWSCQEARHTGCNDNGIERWFLSRCLRAM